MSTVRDGETWGGQLSPRERVALSATSHLRSVIEQAGELDCEKLPDDECILIPDVEPSDACPVCRLHWFARWAFRVASEELIDV